MTPAGLPPKNPPPAWRLRRDQNGGGILVNWGCYDLDYLFGLLDFRLTPRVALARTWPIGQPFAAALRDNRFGVDLGAVHAPLAGTHAVARHGLLVATHVTIVDG